jgi:oxygen-independent coproporphyrinogen-3 oxidase
VTRSFEPAQWSVYVHFPYCAKRCAYCDFATAAVRDIPRDRYLAAVLRELELRSASLPPAPIATVFFGGGTPSLWGARHVGAVIAWLDRWAGLQPDAEVTLEANPGTVEAGDLRAYAAVGVNRVSLGVQALDDRRLRWLDRVHDADAARETLSEIEVLLATGVLRSASADVIFGVPGQTLGDLRRDVDGVLSYGLPHLSAYALTVEPGTPLQRAVAKGRVPGPDDGVQAEMLAALPEWVGARGLQRYEVSNYARPGHAARHNLAYWTGAHYLAVGVGAHGFLPAQHSALAGIRYGNMRDTTRWMDGLGAGQLTEELRETIDSDTHLTERVLTGLRLDAGLDLVRLACDVGPDRVARLVRRAHDAAARGVAIRHTQDRLVVPAESVRWLDGIVAALM